MQGAFSNTYPARRFKTKKAFREQIAADPTLVILEATSLHGNEYGGILSDAPDGNYYVVGPDPYTARNWYAQVTIRGGKATVK
jgi:hypothetical protein